MTNTLLNILRFSFHFHKSMGNELHEFGPEYILEKWIKYFGDLKPNPISDTTHVHLRNYFSKWIDIWGEDSYTVMSKYLSIIYSINTNEVWLPSELISTFEKSTTGEISNIEYRGLHAILERKFEKWLDLENVKKDILQINRDIKIKNILS